jgi:hypothetical protein
MTKSRLAAPALSPRNSAATGPAMPAQVMQEEFRSGRNAVDMEYSLGVARSRLVPRRDCTRERPVDEKAVLAWMLQHVAPSACWCFQRPARDGMASRSPGKVRSGGHTRVVRNYG